jgi:hypothetical protein
LREAIWAANGAAGHDTIAFSLPVSATIVISDSQLPLITDGLTIDGSTAVSLTIGWSPFTGTFKIGSGTAVTLTTLSISRVTTSTIFGQGGAVYIDGGSLNLYNTTIKNIRYSALANLGGTITIVNSSFSRNRSFTGGALINGSDGRVTIQNSIFYRNGASNVFSGIAYGGAIVNRGVMTITNSTFKENGVSAKDILTPGPPFFAYGSGGAIANSETLIVQNSTFENNYTGAGAPYFLHPFNTNLSGSQDDFTAIGGGIHNSGILTVSNSTFSRNRTNVFLTFNNVSPGSYNSSGAAISNFGTSTIINSTFSDNVTDISPLGETDGGALNNTGQLTLLNSIIANSGETGDCVNSGSFLLNLNNLIEDGRCNPALTGDPLLGPLQDNGGPTWTYALLSPSPAVDMGNNAICAAPPVGNIDQRGVARPIDGTGGGVPICDIGAYEYDGPPPDRTFMPLLLRN